MACVLKTDYTVAAGEIFLTIIIGDAQIGASYLSINGEKIAAGQIKNQKIGDGAELKTKTLLVKTIVSDVNNKTNRTSVTYQLKGGVKDCTYGLEATVANEGDSINYEAEFKFI